MVRRYVVNELVDARAKADWPRVADLEQTHGPTDEEQAEVERLLLFILDVDMQQDRSRRIDPVLEIASRCPGASELSFAEIRERLVESDRERFDDAVAALEPGDVPGLR